MCGTDKRATFTSHTYSHTQTNTHKPTQSVGLCFHCVYTIYMLAKCVANATDIIAASQPKCKRLQSVPRQTSTSANRTRHARNTRHTHATQHEKNPPCTLAFWLYTEYNIYSTHRASRRNSLATQPRTTSYVAQHTSSRVSSKSREACFGFKLVAFTTKSRAHKTHKTQYCDLYLHREYRLWYPSRNAPIYSDSSHAQRTPGARQLFTP